MEHIFTVRVKKPTLLAARGGLRPPPARGSGGKLTIHPAQIEPIKRGFLPSEETLEWTRNVLAVASDRNAVKIGAEMVDLRPVLQG
ncbi:hypothetical protein A4U53_021285 [Rhizobium ruizarguesonis]|uniref:Uncharacterized protein n=1 Tax=Rhizobium ruizarguesonis TaxID=2081791 RepID=A0ACD5EV04_9HYPH